MDFIEVLLGRIFRNGVYKHRTTVNDFSRHATNQIHFLLSLSSGSHDDDKRLFFACIMQDFLFRHSFLQHTGIFHVGQLSLRNPVFYAVGQLLQLFMNVVEHTFNAQFMFHRQSVTLGGILQARHIHRAEIHMHQYYLRLNLSSKIESKLTRSH